MAVKSALVNVMEKACRKAARGLLRDFGEVEQLQVSQKGPADFVTEADLRAERILKEELSKARPEYGLLMEEGTAREGDGRHRWIVDPLDGTTNFMHGIPHFAISIGLEEDGELVAGMIFHPVPDEMYYAEKGRGAFLNDRRLRVSGRTQISQSLFATGIPFKGHGESEPFLSELNAVMSVSSGVRRFGSAALDLAYVAAGRYEGFWETGLKHWDLAAGTVIVREAGGFVSGADGKSDILRAKDLVAASDAMHRPLCRLLREARKAAPKAAAETLA